MIFEISEEPFLDLPEALVEELLSRCEDVSSGLFTSFKKIDDERSRIRSKLSEGDLLHRDSEISSMPVHPTSCGVDGAYAVERLLSTDIAATAALAVEGLTPPSEKRFWPKPRHFCEILAVPHYDSTANVLRAVMMCMELELAVTAPHDVVMIDGSLTTPLIYINQALNQLNESSEELAGILSSRIENTINDVTTIIESRRSDKIFVALPKYTTKKVLSSQILELGDYEDRGLLSFVLESGEYVGPIEKGATSAPWNVERISPQYQGFVSDYLNKIRSLQIFYYRPYEHIPVLRLEVSNSIARNPQRLSVLFEAIRIQCGAPSIFEPYPLYLADRMAKHLSKALPALRRTATQDISEGWENRLGNAFLAMYGYRTDWGK
jgi:hypothetical protein